MTSGGLIWATISLLPLVMVVAAAAGLQVSVGHLTRDLAAICNLHPLSGALSSLGILLWFGCATLYGFSAWQVTTRQHARAAAHLMCYAGLSAYLCLDDLFQIHETLAPRYLGWSEKAVYGLLALAMTTHLWVHRHVHVRTAPGVLLLSLCGLAASVGVDSILAPWAETLHDWSYLLEDGFKWLGITAWAWLAIEHSRLAWEATVSGP